MKKTVLWCVYIYIYILYVYIYIYYIYIYCHIYMHIYVVMKTMCPRLSPQWLCGNSYTWAHDVPLHIAGTNKPKSAQQAKQGV